MIVVDIENFVDVFSFLFLFCFLKGVFLLRCMPYRLMFHRHHWLIFELFETLCCCVINGKSILLLYGWVVAGLQNCCSSLSVLNVFVLRTQLNYDSTSLFNNFVVNLSWPS